jgi:hypothetical protein
LVSELFSESEVEKRRNNYLFIYEVLSEFLRQNNFLLVFSIHEILMHEVVAKLVKSLTVSRTPEMIVVDEFVASAKHASYRAKIGDCVQGKVFALPHLTLLQQDLLDVREQGCYDLVVDQYDVLLKLPTYSVPFTASKISLLQHLLMNLWSVGTIEKLSEFSID